MCSTRSACSFAGSMRANLIRMLDELRLPAALGLESSSELFGSSWQLLHTTSALRYPVFKSGKNYSGSPRPTRHHYLRTMVEELLGPELERVRSSLVVPLGKAASECLQYLSDHGCHSRSRCFRIPPEPTATELRSLHGTRTTSKGRLRSGSPKRNGHRIRRPQARQMHYRSRPADPRSLPGGRWPANPGCMTIETSKPTMSSRLWAMVLHVPQNRLLTARLEPVSPGTC